MVTCFVKFGHKSFDDTPSHLILSDLGASTWRDRDLTQAGTSFPLVIQLEQSEKLSTPHRVTLENWHVNLNYDRLLVVKLSDPCFFALCSLVLVTLHTDYSVSSCIKHRVKHMVTGKDVLFSARCFPCPASNALSETDSKQHV